MGPSAFGKASGAAFTRLEVGTEWKIRCTRVDSEAGQERMDLPTMMGLVIEDRR